MSGINPSKLDKTGKVVLDQVYNRDTPLPFYSGIEQLDYCLPQQAKPLFEKVLDLLRANAGKPGLKLVDLGCSYGVNGALLKWGFDLEEVYSHYKKSSAQTNDRQTLLRLDREWLKARQSDHQARKLQIIGVDIAKNALDYALDAQFIDGMIDGDFEQAKLDDLQRDVIAGAELIISTGCIGYITHKTISALLDALAPRQPWMAHFVLRMFSFDDMQEMLEARGYKTIKSRHPVRQRQFSSPLERQKVLERLSSMPVETRDLEQQGWYYADLFLSRPAGDHQITLPEGLQDYFDL